MALKITCPSCSERNRLEEPFPLPGAEVQCQQCARVLTISYPPGMVSKLRARGVRFIEPLDAGPTTAPPPRTPPAPAPKPTVAVAPRPAAAAKPAPAPLPDTVAISPPEPATTRPTRLDGRATRAEDRRTVMERAPIRPTEVTELLSSGDDTDGAAFPDADEATAEAAPTRPSVAPPAAKPRDPGPPARPPRTPPTPPAVASPPPRKRSWLSRVLRWGVALVLIGGLAGVGVVAGAFWYYGRDLPTLEVLGAYRPPTVTEIYDRNGQLLGEIYEKRRYVVELEDIPKHVQDAFIAAEDANFWTHDGVDPEGILRAVGRNALKGRKAQGASTITQQVARNFLLTSEKSYARKIREVILARRIEEAFTKDHILYLYLNQIYLGSGAYGVEAAARTYFDKHVGELTLPEAAILAGLPQRPSDYSPFNHADKARARQEYVLGQMRDKGYLTDADFQAAMSEAVEIIRHDNELLTLAPHFTEHIRRYLVDTYGFDKIYNDGLVVRSTCDLALQQTAQAAVSEGALTADNRVGWRGSKEKLEEAAIQPRLDAAEQALRVEESQRVLRVADPTSGVAGYGPLPDQSTLEAGRRYEAVVLEVAPRHAVVGVGEHKALIPLSWTTWAYPPNPERSWKYRGQNDLTNVLSRGDVVDITLEGPSSLDFDNLKGYTEAGPGPFAAAKLYQTPALESALLSYRVSDGAVLAIVGGTDFENSEYNRATQARRQVGSTFKPIVYAAAIESKKFTAGSLVQDAPTVFNVLNDELWKPGNYGNEYLGNITLRKALQLSRNVCTIRVLDKLGLDAVFDLAGPRLRIGYPSPSCSRTHVPLDAECAGTMTPSTVAGMAWCEYCDPTSCPLVKTKPEFSCMDDPTLVDGEEFCHSCDVNLRVCDWLPIEKWPATDPCTDERRDEDGNTFCRSCDLSMGLGSSSLTMVELVRAYSAFATYGHLVEPHWVDEVVDRDGTVIERYTPPEDWPEVLEPSVAGIAHWLLREVATGGTGAKSNRLGLQVAGKTGTTNDFFDAWFVGYNSDVIAAAWVGYDQPRTMGLSFTGGDTALPIWMDYMAVAVPKDEDRGFPAIPNVEMVPIDESTGRVAVGGRAMPMLHGTAPNNVVIEVGQKTSEDLLTSDF